MQTRLYNERTMSVHKIACDHRDYVESFSDDADDADDADGQHLTGTIANCNNCGA